MNNPELKERTKSFAVRVIKVVEAMPNNRIASPLANQIIRSGTSVAANYRAVCLSKSRADFISKLKTCIEEVDETALWLELISESDILEWSRLESLHNEANELLAIFLSSAKTARDNA
ncbi:MAG: four helix bundle protein [Akkermansiaceae bacterium]|nr:four helix bundle protein [Akkermansiaceae bacterium]